MSDAENFLNRWSRRKRETAVEPDKARVESPDAAANNEAREKDNREAKPDAPTDKQKLSSNPPPFDPASLPSIESITAETDIRAFMAPGVPADLTRAALRRAWAADPTIREFKGLADYDWDFTASDPVAGFGSLEMTDDLRRHITKLVGQLSDPSPSNKPPAVRAPEQVSPQTEESPLVLNTVNESSIEKSPIELAKTQENPRDENGFLHRNTVDIALQKDIPEEENEPEPWPHRGGRALPK